MVFLHFYNLEKLEMQLFLTKKVVEESKVLSLRIHRTKSNRFSFKLSQ